MWFKWVYVHWSHKIWRTGWEAAICLHIVVGSSTMVCSFLGQPLAPSLDGISINIFRIYEMLTCSKCKLPVQLSHLSLEVPAWRSVRRRLLVGSCSVLGLLQFQKSHRQCSGHSLMVHHCYLSKVGQWCSKNMDLFTCPLIYASYFSSSS